MAVLKLDPKKLLGFKIVVNGQLAATVRSPKIGGKLCATADPMSNATPRRA